MHWLIEKYNSGERDFHGANLRWTDLSDANLSDANLVGANLRWSYLTDANLRGANLRGVDLIGANLTDANLSKANLCGADLRGANLAGTNLTSAKYDIKQILLASWGVVSDDLCRSLMRLDAANHPDPDRFIVWAHGGPCPYVGLDVSRVVLFQESRSLYDPNWPTPTMEEAWRMISEEKGMKI